MLRGLLCTVCLFWAGSTGAVAAQTVTEPDSITLTSVGERARVRLYRISDGRLRPARNPLWISRDPAVAEVTESSGWVTAMTAGSAWIVASSRDGADSAYVSVDVDPGPPPLLAPEILSVDGADSLGVVVISWASLEGAEDYALDAGGPDVPPISIITTALHAAFQMTLLDTAYEGWVCINGRRGEEEGPDACEVYQVPAASLPPLEAPTGVALDEVVQADTIFYTYTWDAVVTADSYEAGAGPDDPGGGIDRGPTWTDVPTPNLFGGFHQIRDLDDYTGQACVKAIRDEERSEDSCLAYTVPRVSADSVQTILTEAPPEVIYLSLPDTLPPDSTAWLWGWDTDTRLRIKSIAFGVEFELCGRVWFRDNFYLREITWSIVPIEGPADILIPLVQTSPSCHTFKVNPDYTPEMAGPILTWLANLPREGREGRDGH